MLPKSTQPFESSRQGPAHREHGQSPCPPAAARAGRPLRSRRPRRPPGGAVTPPHGCARAARTGEIRLDGALVTQTVAFVEEKNTHAHKTITAPLTRALETLSSSPRVVSSTLTCWGSGRKRWGSRGVPQKSTKELSHVQLSQRACWKPRLCVQ